MDALQHLDLLGRYDRALNLRSAVLKTVQPGQRVLDAGCGAGLLSFWAAQAGAASIVAVDLEGVDLAHALARDNGFADTIEFYQDDLRTLDLPEHRNGFDVVMAMVYLNDPRRDESQSRLAYELRDRFLASGGVMIPDRVRYTVRLCDWPAQDWPTMGGEFSMRIADLEGRYGFDFGSLGRKVLSTPWKTLFPPKNPNGRVVMDGVRILSDPVVFADIDYRAAPVSYPDMLEIAVRAPGTATVLLWNQELLFENQLLFSNESVSWIADPRRIDVGSRSIVRFDDRWRNMNVVDIAPADRAGV